MSFSVCASRERWLAVLGIMIMLQRAVWRVCDLLVNRGTN